MTISEEKILRIKENIMKCLDKMSYTQIQAFGVYLAKLIGAEMTHDVINVGTEDEMIIYRRSDCVHAINTIVNNSDESNSGKYIDLSNAFTILVGMNLLAKANQDKELILKYYNN